MIDAGLVLIGCRAGTGGVPCRTVCGTARRGTDGHLPGRL